MPKNLLLADDSVTMQKVVAIAFACEDFKITVVDNGEDALARARELKPDIVLADVVMPKQTGYDVCAALKADPALRHVPVLLLAGRSEKFDEAKARAAQADGHIEKPFESAALINKVKELVERKVAPAPQPVPTLQPPPRAAAPVAPQVAPAPAPVPHVAPAPAPVPTQPRPAAARPAAPPPAPVAPPFAARQAAPPAPPAPPFAAAVRPPAPPAPPVAPPFAARAAVIPPPAPVAPPVAPPLSAAPARPAVAPARPAVAPPRPEVAAAAVAARAASVAAAAIAAEPEPEEWADIELEDVVEDDRGEARDSLLAASAISFEEPEPVVAAAPPVADPFAVADPFDAMELSAPPAAEPPPSPAWEPPPPLAFDPEPPAFDHDLAASAQAPEAMTEPQAQVVSSVEELDFGEPPPAIDLAAEAVAPPASRLPQLELDGPGLELDAPVHVFAKAGAQVDDLEPTEELDPVADHESEPAWAAAGVAVEVPEPLDALPEPLSLSPAHEFLPPAANTGHAPEGSAAAPNGDGGEAQLREALSKASREVIERIAWEVVPQLAEVILREHVERLARSRENR